MDRKAVEVVEGQSAPHTRSPQSPPPTRPGEVAGAQSSKVAETLRAPTTVTWSPALLVGPQVAEGRPDQRKDWLQETVATPEREERSKESLDATPNPFPEADRLTDRQIDRQELSSLG